MARRDAPPDDEKRSYGALWLVLSLLLFAGALWAITDDNIVRRPWKKFQAGFNRLEITRLKTAIQTEQQRLDADAAYQEATKSLAEARKGVTSGDEAHRIAELQRELVRAQEADQSKDLNLRFIKSELEELRFQYDDAIHHGRPSDAILHRIEEGEHLREERQRIYAESQQQIEAIQNEIKSVQGSVKTGEDALAKLTTTRDDLQQKLEGVSLGYLPGPVEHPPFVGFDWQPRIPKIQQVVLEQFDRNNFDQPIARVDRCTSCHSGINKAGFEDQPNPWKTHPKRELFLGKHDPDKFGCTPCHNGDGTAVNSPRSAHCDYYDADGQLREVHLRSELALFRGEKMQANCIKCHPSVQHLEGAPVAARGETLFVELGCHGCHLADGYEDLAKVNGISIIGPSLRRIGAKDDHAWMVRWITNPHEFRPRTRMPNFMFTPEQAEKITAYLLSTTKEPSAQWLEAHPDPAIATNDDLAQQGRKLKIGRAHV